MEAAGVASADAGVLAGRLMLGAVEATLATDSVLTVVRAAMSLDLPHPMLTVARHSIDATATVRLGLARWRGWA